jgi:hypothetical protein
MKDARLLSPGTLAAKEAHQAAIASGKTPGCAFDIACAAYSAAHPEATIWELQAIIAEAIGMWRRDAERPAVS